MTVLGKILVVVNLVFCLVVGALSVVVYATRTNWASQYRKLEERHQAATKASETYAAELARAYAEADRRVADKQKEVDDVKAKRDEVAVKLAQVQEDLNKARANYTAKQTEADRLGEELKRKQQDSDLLADTLKKRDEQNNVLLKNYKEAKAEAVNAEIQLRGMQLRNEQLLAKLQSAEEDVRRLAANGTLVPSGQRPVTPVSKPPEDVEGLIKKVGTDGLVAITIGSDSGIEKGHILQASRPNLNAPAQSKYLGEIQIIEVAPKEAVGRPVRKAGPTPLQVGDRVSTGL